MSGGISDKDRRVAQMVLEIVRLVAAALAGFFAGTDGVQAIVWTWWSDPVYLPALVMLAAGPVVMPGVRKPWERVRVTTPVGELSRTKQSFREEADINAIMRRYLRTGILESQARGTPRYGDFTSAEDFHACMTRVRNAEELFLRLPAEVRDYVDNDPKELLELVFDPARVDEARALGLIPEVPNAEGGAPVPAGPAVRASGEGPGSVPASGEGASAAAAAPVKANPAS